MYQIERLQLPLAHNLNAWAALTEAIYQERLSSSLFDTIAIGATFHDKPVGLLIVNIIPNIYHAQILSLYVAEEHRHHKLATQLLTRAEQELKRIDCSVMILLYAAEAPTTPILEHLLSRQEWHKPQRFSIHCRFDGFTFNPPWLAREYPLPPGFRLFPWTALTNLEREQLQRNAQQGVFPASVSPFKDEARVEWLNSLGLRYKGEVIGWMVTHRVAFDTIKYNALFIQRQWQYHSPAMRLLCDAIKLQKLSTIQWGSLDINLGEVEPSWFRFVKRRLVPYATQVSYTMQATKGLI